MEFFSFNSVYSLLITMIFILLSVSFLILILFTPTMVINDIGKLRRDMAICLTQAGLASFFFITLQESNMISDDIKIETASLLFNLIGIFSNQKFISSIIEFLILSSVIVTAITLLARNKSTNDSDKENEL